MIILNIIKLIATMVMLFTSVWLTFETFSPVSESRECLMKVSTVVL